MNDRRGSAAGSGTGLRAGSRIGATAALGLVLAATTGCPPGEVYPTRQVHEPVAMEQAIGVVNQNDSRLQVTLKARAGHAKGHFTDTDGSRREFDADAALLVHPPRHMRLVLSVLGNEQLVFGSNEERYWVVQPAADALTWGRYNRQIMPNAGDLIIRPDLIVEALGITPLPEKTTGDRGPVQRITDEHQQLIFIGYDRNLQGFIRKEYWLSRQEPRLVDRIIFRDLMGTVLMDSRLSQYQRIEPDGPLMPHRIEIEWPATDGAMLFTARGWQALPQVQTTAAGFQFPLDRGETFDRIVDLDVELDAIHNPPTEDEILRQQLAMLGVDEPESVTVVENEPVAGGGTGPCGLPEVPQGERPSLAVVDFSLPPYFGEDAGLGLAEQCRGMVARAARYDVLGRQGMLGRVSAAELDEASQCIERSCLQDFGRKLGVREILHGQVYDMGEELVLTLVVLDVDAGEVTATWNDRVVGGMDTVGAIIDPATCELLRLAMTPQP